MNKVIFLIKQLIYDFTIAWSFYIVNFWYSSHLLRQKLYLILCPWTWNSASGALLSDTITRALLIETNIWYNPNWPCPTYSVTTGNWKFWFIPIGLDLLRVARKLRILYLPSTLHLMGGRGLFRSCFGFSIYIVIICHTIVGIPHVYPKTMRHFSFKIIENLIRIGKSKFNNMLVNGY